MSEAIVKQGVVSRVVDALLGKQSAKIEIRDDGWANSVTGSGEWGSDKTMHTRMLPVRELRYGEIESLYYGDDISALIVDSLPDEMFRRGYTIESEQQKDVLAQAKALGVNEKMCDAIRWARAWGGASMVLGVDDGQTADKPLIIEKCRGVKFINVVDRRYINPVSFYEQALSPKFGQPELFQITPAFGGNIQNVIVHETRLIKFWGTKIDPITTRRLAGWSYSALQRPYDVMRQFCNAFEAAGQLAYDAGQGVFKMKGLIELLASPNRNAALQRIALADSARYSGRSLAIDADGEEFSRTPTPLAGVGDLLDRFMMRLAAAARMPVTMLMGRSPAGENATGESDMAIWHNRVKAEQTNIIAPALELLFQIMTAGKYEGSTDFVGLKEPNDLDAAKVETETANKWKTYVDMTALTGEQVTAIQFLEKPIEEVIDDEALMKAIQDDADLMKNPPPEPDPSLAAFTAKPPTMGKGAPLDPNKASGPQVQSKTSTDGSGLKAAATVATKRANKLSAIAFSKVEHRAAGEAHIVAASKNRAVVGDESGAHADRAKTHDEMTTKHAVAAGDEWDDEAYPRGE